MLNYSFKWVHIYTSPQTALCDMMNQSLLMIFVSVLSLNRKVAQHEAETAGAIMAFFLSLGLALGAAVSFAFRAMI